MKVTIEEYLDNNDDVVYGVYRAEDGILIEEGFATEEMAITWANENGYDTDPD